MAGGRSGTRSEAEAPISCRAAPNSDWAAGLVSTTRPPRSSTSTGSDMVPMTASRANGAMSRNRRLNSDQAAAAPLTATMSGVKLNEGSSSTPTTKRPWKIQGRVIAMIIAAARPR